MDRVLVFGTSDEGSIPSGRTNKEFVSGFDSLASPGDYLVRDFWGKKNF